MASPRRDDTTGISHNSSHIITVIDVQPVDNEDTDDNASIGTFSCELCLSVVPQSAVHTMTCGHSCCVPCLRQGVAVALGSGAVPAQCPYYCGIALTPMEVAAIAGEVYAK